MADGRTDSMSARPPAGGKVQIAGPGYFAIGGDALLQGVVVRLLEGPHAGGHAAMCFSSRAWRAGEPFAAREDYWRGAVRASLAEALADLKDRCAATSPDATWRPYVSTAPIQ